MDLTPLAKWSNAELLAELDLYRDNPVDGVEYAVAPADDLKNVAARAAEVERLRGIVGYVHTVTEEDADANKGVTDFPAVGEVVYLSQEEVDEKTKAAAAAKEKADADAAAAAKKAGKAGKTEEAAPAPARQELVYKGRTLVRAPENKLVHGKSYVEVDIGTEVYTLTKEEFEADVRPRGE